MEIANPNFCKNKPSRTVGSQNVVGSADRKEDNESTLLLPCRRGAMSKKPKKKTGRKVQWNDKNGNKLVEVLEFEPRKAGNTCMSCLVEQESEPDRGLHRTGT
uniref:Uncharacterized protein n=1 Tax=Nelumbo nucifera TaxID=4432 RepID=A0A822XJY3_NELNU|nr:TPA_asm: hypothetical protein HUJ06_021476 [Nelumbo nucifera]